MLESIVTDPEGNEFVVTHPEGASQKDIIDFFAQSNALQPSAPGTMDAPDNFAVDFLKGLFTGGGQATVGSAAGLTQWAGQAFNNNSMLDAAEDMRQYSQGIGESIGLDQDFQGSFIGQVTQGLGQVPVTIGAGMAGFAVGGPPGALAAAALTTGGQMTSEFLTDMEQSVGKQYTDFDEAEKDAALKGMLAQTAIGTTLELVAVGKAARPLIRRLQAGKGVDPKKLKKALEQDKGALREATEAAGAEGGTEALTGQSQDTLASMLYEEDRELFTMNTLKRRALEFGVGAVVGGTVSGGSQVLGSPGKNSTTEKDLDRPVENRSEVPVPKEIEVTYVPVPTDGGPLLTTITLSIDQDADPMTAAVEILGDRRLPGGNITVTEYTPAPPIDVQLGESEGAVLEEDVPVDPAPTPTPTPEPAPDQAPEGEGTPIPAQRDYRNVKVGDTFEIVGVNGKTSQVEAVGISDESGMIRFKREDGTFGVTGNEKDSVFQDINSPDYYMQAAGHGTQGKLIKDLSAEELDALEASINKKFESDPYIKQGIQGTGRSNVSDFNAIKLERRRRAGATEGPTPAPEPSVETAPESEPTPSTDPTTGKTVTELAQDVGITEQQFRETYPDLSRRADERARSTEAEVDPRTGLPGFSLPQNLKKGKPGYRQTQGITFASDLERAAYSATTSTRSEPGKRKRDSYRKLLQDAGYSSTEINTMGREVRSQMRKQYKGPGSELSVTLPQDIVAQAAPLQTIDFIKGASGDPAQNLASKKRRRAGTGEGKNPSLRLEVNGLPIYIGKDSAGGGKSFEGWTEETSAWFTDQEINNAAGWYDSLKSKFTKEFGPERGPKMMLAWLASQQNESPSGGVRNTFRVIDRLTGIKSGKKGGLADEKLEAIFTDTLADKGLDAKLSDFIDAGMGKRTRTFMGDDADGGMPFVADVHTGRDSGKLDQQTLTRIKRFADSGVLSVDGQPASVEITKVKKKTIKGKTKTEPEEAILRVGGQEVKLVRDLTGSPSKGEYEGISDWGNRLTDYLNSIGWKGRTDWIPAEVQAVGWMRTLRQYGLKESDLESSLIENTFRVAAEVDYGLGSKITQIYPDFQKLNEQQKTEITEDVLGFIVPRVQQEMAPSAILRDSEFGIGSWEGSVSPSGNFYVMGSDEAANIFTNSLAWVTEQAGTMRAVIGKGGKNQRAVALVGLSDNELSNFVDFVNQIQTGTDKKAAKEAESLRGFSTRAMPGEQGIVVFGLTESKARGVKNTLQKFAEQYTGSDSLTIQNFSAVTTFTENNWKENQNGESYIQEIEQSGSTGNIRERLLRLRQQYGQRLAETGQRIAPEVFGETSIQSRVDQFVEAGKEYLEGTGTDVIAEAAPADVTAQAAETAAEDRGPQDTFDSINQLEDFISKSFSSIAGKMGINIYPNMLGQFVAQYNVSQKIIEYNPRALLNRTKAGVQAAMREEIIHAAMHNVLIQREKKARTGRSEDALWVDFFTALGNNLTPQERAEIQNVYQSLQEGDTVGFGSEYSRAVVQKFRYGDFTEQYIAVDKGGPAFQAIVDLLRSVQAYMAKVLGPMVKTDPEAAQVIVDTVELLNAIDPTIRPKNQQVVANAYDAVDKNAAEESAQPGESADAKASERIREERKWWADTAARQKVSKYLTPIITRLNRINPMFGRIIQNLDTKIRERSFKNRKQTEAFFSKLNSIKGDQFLELKQLLYFSPTPDEANLPKNKAVLQRRDALLHKYGLLNMYRLDIQPILEEIYAEYTKLGMPAMGYLEEYFPRVVKDLKGLIKSYGQKTKRTFELLVDEENKRRSKLTDKDGLPAPLPPMEKTELARFFQDFLQNKFRLDINGVKLPGNVKAREITLIPRSKLKFYDNPGIAFGKYTANMNRAIESFKVVGDTRKGDNRLQGELGKLTEELFSAGQINLADADELKTLTELITTQFQAENEILKSLGTITYMLTLINPGPVLVQIMDLYKVALKRGFGAALSGTYRTVTGNRRFDIEKDFFIAKTTLDAEFQDPSFLQKALDFGLSRLVPFRQMDIAMKHASIEATYDDFMKKAKSPVGSKKYQQLLDYLTIKMGPVDAQKAIDDLKLDRAAESSEVKEALLSELLERQPLTYLQVPEGYQNNPASRIFYKLSSYMLLDLNYNRQEFMNDLAGPGKTLKQRTVALRKLAYMATLLTIFGMPSDLLDDWIAGKDTYIPEHVMNNILGMFGFSRYTTTRALEKGFVDSAMQRFSPPVVNIILQAEKDFRSWVKGDVELFELRSWRNSPLSDVWYNRVGGGETSQERLRNERAKEGIFPDIYR